MDKVGDKKEVSLPGAGEAEPSSTILEELNRSLVVSSVSQLQEEELHNEKSSQQPDQLNQQHDNESFSHSGEDDDDDENHDQHSEVNSDDDELCSDDDNDNDEDLSENASVVATVVVQEIVQHNENEVSAPVPVKTQSDRLRTTSASDFNLDENNDTSDAEVNREPLGNCDSSNEVGPVELLPTEAGDESRVAQKLGHRDSDEERQVGDHQNTAQPSKNQVLLDSDKAVSVELVERVESHTNDRLEGNVAKTVQANEPSAHDDHEPEKSLNIFRQEGYVPLRDSLDREISPPPVPLVTYRWEEARRAREKGGYPWTYLDPLEPRNHEPHPILRLSCSPKHRRKSTDTCPSSAPDSPRSLKKVRINDDIQIAETPHSIVSSDSDSQTFNEDPINLQPPAELATIQQYSAELNTEPQTPISTPKKDSEAAKAIANLKSILKRAHPHKKIDITKACSTTADLPSAAAATTAAEKTVGSTTAEDNNTSPTIGKFCHPFVEKLKTMADKQYHKGKRNIKKYTLRGDDAKIVLDEPQQILNLKESPRAERKEFASYVVKQDSDDVPEIMTMDESPSEVRRRREDHEYISTVVVPDEIIALPTDTSEPDAVSIEPTITELLEEEFRSNPPKKSPRKHKDHHYEDIDDDDDADPTVKDFIAHLSLHRQDESIADELKSGASLRPISSIDSSEFDEESGGVADKLRATTAAKNGLLAPLSSVDSTSSDDERRAKEDAATLNVVLEIREPGDEVVKRSNLKRETSPGAEKKVTFSPSTEDEPADEPHREDVDLPEHLRAVDNRWAKMR